MRGSGAVSARQARREAARSETAQQIEGLADAARQGETTAEHIDSIARHTASLTNEQREAIDFDDLVERAKSMLPESFNRHVKRQVDNATADQGLDNTKAKQSASEFRHWFDDKNGMGRFSGTLDPERYEMLINAVDRHVTRLASASDKPVHKTANLAAHALVELVTMPTNGESAGRQVASVLVVVDQQTLIDGPHAASLRQTETGADIAPESIARLCCDSIIRRVCLDERGVPLDVGRKYRTATDAQWAAIKASHSSCAWDGCHAPINWCQAHHIRQWEDGGPTDLDNLVPLCSKHHHRVHEGQWHIKLLPDRSLKIYRPDGVHHATVPTPKRC